MRNKKLIRTIIGLLVLQFMLGMLANLYATIPKQKPYEVFNQFGFIAFHALNATLLLVLGCILAFKIKKQRGFKLAISGVASIVLAITFGEFFVFTQNNLFSFFMALAFIGALLSYSRLAFSNSSKLK